MSRSTRHVITSEWIDLAEGGLPTGTLETIDFETESSVALLAPPRRPAPIAWEDDEDEDEDFLDDDEDLDLGDDEDDDDFFDDEDDEDLDDDEDFLEDE